MTDYEKLIKEARTLEGMYYKGKKIVQGCVGKVDDRYCIAIRGEHDNNITEIDWSDDIDDILNELEAIKNKCYKPLTKVNLPSTASDLYEEYVHIIDAYQCLKRISNEEIDADYVFDAKDVTPIKEIHKEIKRILNEMYND